MLFLYARGNVWIYDDSLDKKEMQSELAAFRFFPLGGEELNP